MRERIKDYDRLLHIMEAIANVFEFLEGKTVDDLTNDKLLFYGVVKNVEIIGEAAYMLTNELRVSILPLRGLTLSECAMCSYMVTTLQAHCLYGIPTSKKLWILLNLIKEHTSSLYEKNLVRTAKQMLLYVFSNLSV